MVLVKIARKDKPKSMTYTNTGLRKIIPTKEWFFYKGGSTFSDPLALFLLYESESSIFSSQIMYEIAWYTRTYFGGAKDLDIQIKTKEEIIEGDCQC